MPGSLGKGSEFYFDQLRKAGGRSQGVSYDGLQRGGHEAARQFIVILVFPTWLGGRRKPHLNNWLHWDYFFVESRWLDQVWLDQVGTLLFAEQLPSITILFPLSNTPSRGPNPYPQPSHFCSKAPASLSVPTICNN